jgi:hypothetical protein
MEWEKALEPVAGRRDWTRVRCLGDAAEPDSGLTSNERLRRSARGAPRPPRAGVEARRPPYGAPSRRGSSRQGAGPQDSLDQHTIESLCRFSGRVRAGKMTFRPSGERAGGMFSRDRGAIRPSWVRNLLRPSGLVGPLRGTLEIRLVEVVRHGAEWQHQEENLDPEVLPQYADQDDQRPSGELRVEGP